MNFRTLNPTNCRAAGEEAPAEERVSEMMLPVRASHMPQGLCEMSMEHDWQEKTEYSEKILTPCHFAHYKSHLDSREIGPEPPRCETGN
jgi:hypothetical protein